MVKPGRRYRGRQNYTPLNDRELVYTYDQIQREWDVKSRSTVVKAIDELVDKGLVDIVRQGAGTFKQTSVYGLSDRWEKWHPLLAHRRHSGFVEEPRLQKPRHPGFKKRRPDKRKLGFLKFDGPNQRSCFQVRQIEPAS